MTIKIGRRPYTKCPFRWRLEIDGVGTGEGSISDQQCAVLNGKHYLDFKACMSNGPLLIWESDCQDEYTNVPCTEPDQCKDLAYRLEISGFGDPSSECYDKYNGVFTLTGGRNGCTAPYDVFCNQPTLPYSFWIWNGCDLASIEKTVIGEKYGLAQYISPPDGICLNCTTIAGIEVPIWTFGLRTVGYEGFPDPDELTCLATHIIPHGTWALSAVDSWWSEQYSVGAGRYKMMEYVMLGDQKLGDPTIVLTKWAMFDGSCLSEYPDTVTMTRIYPDPNDDPIGPQSNESTKGKWRLEYNIEKEEFTLHSHDHIEYPIYKRSDSEPCPWPPVAKTLTLVTSSGDNGCAAYPAEVTIYPKCPPQRKARVLEDKDRKRSYARGTHRVCGCDCQDEPDDRKWECETNNASADEIGDFDPEECKYPISLDMCEYCEDDTAPCAYEAFFGCDISFDGEEIAAEKVTLRHKCYFEDECDWVAIGKTPDDFLGAQPTCATCSKDSPRCLSGCIWDQWEVAECPTGLRCCVNVSPPVDKTKCIEFKWSLIDDDRFTVGGVAATLHFVSEVIIDAGCNAKAWRYESDDGEWVAILYVNMMSAGNANCPGTDSCGYYELTWNNPPSDFNSRNIWYTVGVELVVDVGCVVRNLHDTDVLGRSITYFGDLLGDSEVVMNWVDC